MQVCSSTAAVASGAVSHRFGEDAGRVTSSALCAVGSTVGAVHNVASLGRRGLVTNVTKCAATGVAKTVAADDAWELYDLIDDPFETRDLAAAGGDEPQSALADLRAWVLAGNFSCECFQC